MSHFNKVTCRQISTLQRITYSASQASLRLVTKEYTCPCVFSWTHMHSRICTSESKTLRSPVVLTLFQIVFIKLQVGWKGEDRNGKDISLLPTFSAEILPKQDIKCLILKGNFVTIFTRPFFSTYMKGFITFLSLSDQNAILPPEALAFFVVNCFSININTQMSSLSHYISCII